MPRTSFRPTPRAGRYQGWLGRSTRRERNGEPQVSALRGNDRRAGRCGFDAEVAVRTREDRTASERGNFKGPGCAGQGPSDWFPVSTVCRPLKTPSLAIGGSALKAAKHGSHREHIVFGFWRPFHGPSRSLALTWSRRLGGLNGKVFARAVPRRIVLACVPAALGPWRFAATRYGWFDALRSAKVRRAVLRRQARRGLFPPLRRPALGRNPQIGTGRVCGTCASSQAKLAERYSPTGAAAAVRASTPGSASSPAKWQAEACPGATSHSAGCSRKQRSRAMGQRG
jgi:hypothetical protein